MYKWHTCILLTRHSVLAVSTALAISALRTDSRVRVFSASVCNALAAVRILAALAVLVQIHSFKRDTSLRSESSSDFLASRAFSSLPTRAWRRAMSRGGACSVPHLGSVGTKKRRRTDEMSNVYWNDMIYVYNTYHHVPLTCVALCTSSKSS